MNDMILILNYSDEFAVEAAKRLRGERVFCKIISGTTTAAQVAEIAPRGLVLCGEPKSAAGVFDAEILKLDIPVLALGHAAHMLIAAMGGACAGAAISEKKANVQYADCKLFNGVEGGERYIQEAVTLMLPADVQVTAQRPGRLDHPQKLCARHLRLYAVVHDGRGAGRSAARVDGGLD